MSEGALNRSIHTSEKTIGRYSQATRWFHWLTAALIFAVIPTGWIFGAFKTKPGHPDTYVAPFPGSPSSYAAAHMGLGLLILGVVLVRIMYRASQASLPLPAGFPRWQRVSARITHLLLYGTLLAMPISGYVMSAGDKPPIRFLGLFEVPKAPISPSIGMDAAIVHVLIMQFVLYALIAIHLGAVCVHVFLRRDGLLSRMLPRQSNETET